MLIVPQSSPFGGHGLFHEIVPPPRVLTPSRKTIRSFDKASTQPPGMMRPARLSGSEAEIITVSPEGAARRKARSDFTGTGNPNCSPRNPSTKHPQYTSPRSSMRRNTCSNSRHWCGELRRARWDSAPPERNVGRGPVGIFHQQATARSLHLANAP
jgi:hypothetical protein